MRPEGWNMSQVILLIDFNLNLLYVKNIISQLSVIFQK